MLAKATKVFHEQIKDVTEKTKKTYNKKSKENNYVNSQPLVIPNYHSNDPMHYISDKLTGITYLKGKLLGKGGFAKCYELTDVKTKKIYAGKIISKTRISKPHQRDKIIREIELHKPLHNKYVVSFHSYFEDDENVYIILENCSRKSLVHVMKNRKTLTEPEVRYYIRQLVQGTKYIHHEKIIHRDLKLGNMLLNEAMSVKIADFGLATRVNFDGERKMTVCGTPNYIAPEVLQKKGHSYEADIWAIGCVMYAMLVGRPPFETSTLKETYHRITTNKYYIPPHVSSPAKYLIRKLLHPDPACRPTLDKILLDEYFTAGFCPKTLSPNCCDNAPKFPNANVPQRPRSYAAPVTPAEAMRKITDSLAQLKGSKKSASQILARPNDKEDPQNPLPLATISPVPSDNGVKAASSAGSLNGLISNSGSLLGDNNGSQLLNRAMTPGSADLQNSARTQTPNGAQTPNRAHTPSSIGAKDSGVVSMATTTPTSNSYYPSTTPVDERGNMNQENAYTPNSYNNFKPSDDNYNPYAHALAQREAMREREAQKEREALKERDIPSNTNYPNYSTPSSQYNPYTILTPGNVYSTDIMTNASPGYNNPPPPPQSHRHEKRQKYVNGYGQEYTPQQPSPRSHSVQKSSGVHTSRSDQKLNGYGSQQVVNTGYQNNASSGTDKQKHSRSKSVPPSTKPPLQETNNNGHGLPPTKGENPIHTAELKAFPSGSAVRLYQMLSTCIEQMPEDASPSPVHNSKHLWVTKWVDYSNKYGFGFQLSDKSCGVLFNDTTRMLLTPDGKTIQYNDLSNKVYTFATDSPVSDYQKKATLLLYFAQYMDEHLIHGGDMLNHEQRLCEPTGIFMKKWFRTSKAIVMYLNNGTLQVNFFDDHTKVILSPDGQDYLCTYINSSRLAVSYRLLQFRHFGCHHDIADRLSYARKMLEGIINVRGEAV